jgi:hypothetical protein
MVRGCEFGVGYSRPQKAAPTPSRRTATCARSAAARRLGPAFRAETRRMRALRRRTRRLDVARRGSGDCPLRWRYVPPPLWLVSQ